MDEDICFNLTNCIVPMGEQISSASFNQLGCICVGLFLWFLAPIIKKSCPNNIYILKSLEPKQIT